MLEALQSGRSGIRVSQEYRSAGMRSQVAGLPSLAAEPAIDRKSRRFMGEVSAYAYHAMRKAIRDADLQPELVSHAKTGLIIGSGAGSLSSYVQAIDALRAGGMKKVPPYVVPQAMASSASATLATAYRIQGVSYSVSAACSSAAHAIGQAAQLIRSGTQEVVFAGGAEEGGWSSALPFDAMNALSTGYNDRPEGASRPYDTARDGFVMAAGAGMLVLEELSHAKGRGARCYGEICGYGASSGGDMVGVSPTAAAAAMQSALDQAGLERVDYVNTHAIGSEAGDIAELDALRRVFGEAVPLVSSTKGLSGHSLGASAAQEAIYALLMMNAGFVAGCANLEHRDPAAATFPLVTGCMPASVASVMSNSFGFGGTNASLILRTLKA